MSFYKKDYTLLQKYIDKAVSLNIYSKRVFTKDKKDTKPVHSDTH